MVDVQQSMAYNPGRYAMFLNIDNPFFAPSLYQLLACTLTTAAVASAVSWTVPVQN